MVKKTPPETKTARGRLAFIRWEMRQSLREFAATLDVSASTVHCWERGKRVPSGAEAQKVERVYHIPARLWYEDAAVRKGAA